MIGQVILLSCFFAHIDSTLAISISRKQFLDGLAKSNNKGKLLFPGVLEEFLNEFRRSTSSLQHTPTLPSVLPNMELPPPSGAPSSVGQAISKLPAVQLPLQTARSPRPTTQQPTSLTQLSIMSLLRAAQAETVNALNIFIPSDRDQLPRMNLMSLPSLPPAPPPRRLRSELSDILEEESNALLIKTSGNDSPLQNTNSVNVDPKNENVGSPFVSVLSALQPSQRPQNDVHQSSSSSTIQNVLPSVRNHGESSQREEHLKLRRPRPLLTNSVIPEHLEHPEVISQMLSLSHLHQLPWPRVPVTPVTVRLDGYPFNLDKENEIHEIPKENEKNFKENPNTISSFSAILNAQGYKLDISNPDVDINNPKPTTVSQPQNGQKCVSSVRRNIPAAGVCLQLNECTALRSLQKQTQYSQVLLHLYENTCRYEGKEFLFCCPFYSLSAALPGSLAAVAPPPTESLVKVSIPRQGECGKVKVKQGKVIGGVEVQDGQFPWLAVIGVPVSENRFQVTCSGSLITRRHVITAAHCFYSTVTENPTHVRLGETNVNKNTRPLHRDYIIIGKNFPLYHKFISINDVTLLTLDRDVIYDDYVQPGCLPFDFLESPKPGDTVTAVGYGRESSTIASTAVTPNTIDIKVIENSFCQQSYYSSRSFPVVDHRVFCAGGQALMGTCEGDSGGPVHIYDSALDRYVIVGIVKGGGNCGSADLPSVNTKLVPFLPWIESVVKK